MSNTSGSAINPTFGSDCAPEQRTTIDPMTLVAQWTGQAGPEQDDPAQDSTAPPLMALATVTADGAPRVRHVLLSETDDRAIFFHTDADSAKVGQLTADPRASAAIAWPEHGRQLVLSGAVQRATAEEERRVYAGCGRYLQLLAWLNTPEMARLPEEERHRRWAEFDRQHPQLEPPAGWVGYRLVPEEIIFWRADPDGPSQRVRFRRDGDGWQSDVLPG